MIKAYRAYTYLVNVIALIYIAAEIIDGFSTFLTEDFLILGLIVSVLFTSFTLCKASSHFSDDRKGKVISSTEIKSMMKEGNVDKGIVWANFSFGFLISLMMILYIIEESIRNLISDAPRLISILVIVLYGIVQMLFAILIKKKIH
ncbi:hypothetical protein [Labilibacter marinus]|uniref:hypothetical protein n=1 Tax=Labilibacter marinus TaxID=1477105 RepID=UPI00094FFCC3|nr:hypothetical protein [Labilibacter marinus]